jgi:hypothetical protein
MNEDRLQLVGKMWISVLDEQSWSREWTELYRSVDMLRNEALTLRETDSLLHEVLGNQFFRSRMSRLYRKHELQLKSAVKKLGELLCQRREMMQAMQDFYLARQQVRLGNSQIMECELGKSRVKNYMEEVLSHYSYEVLEGQFDRSGVSPVLDEIADMLDSDLFPADCLRILIADFAAGPEASTDDNQLQRIVVELIGGLVQNGHHTRDLLSLGQQMALDDGRSADERFRTFLSYLFMAPRRFTVLTGLQDVRLEDAAAVPIGNVTLFGREHDFSSLLRGVESSTIQKEIRDLFAEAIKSLSNKVSLQISTIGFGPEHALDHCDEEIAKAIDVLSLQDPRALIREPREHHSTMMVLDDRSLPVHMSGTRRLELYGKELDAETLASLDRILQITRHIIMKAPARLSEFERRILTAMHFYRKGNSAFDFVDKVVSYIVCLESMLVMKGERPSTTLPRRVLDVLCVSKEYSPRMRKLVEDAYRHRGEILHYGITDEEKSERVSAELRELDRWLLSILLEYTCRPGLKTFKQFIDAIEKDAVAKRQAMLANAVLDINKNYSGRGILKKTDGSAVGDIGFTVSYRDDGRYVYILGSMTSFRLSGSITETEYFIEATLDGVEGKYMLSLAVSFNPHVLIELLSGRRGAVPFKVREMSRIHGDGAA